MVLVVCTFGTIKVGLFQDFGMSLVNSSQQSVDEEAELLALENLLCNDDGDDETTKSISKHGTKVPPTLQNAVPRLREDNTFANTFSYELNLPAEKHNAAENSTKPEELDSSDDEEVKNFLERKYNEYGSDINKKLKQQRDAEHEIKVSRDIHSMLKEKPANQPFINNQSHQPNQRQSHEAFSSSSFRQSIKTQSHNETDKVVRSPTVLVKATFTDPVFGLRIINPLISSSLLVERMSGRKAVPFSGVVFHIERGDLSKDWVIAGVLVNKNPVRMTKKSEPYSTWRLSDLRGECKMISLFLFKGAHKDLWKTAEGMCLAVLNPTIFEKRAGSNDLACLSIDNSQKVMVLGQSKDLGTCRATKKNGDKCSAVVNVTDCDYCVYHVKQEYGKMSRRSELQSATAGRGLNELRNKVLGKNEVFYGGQSFSAVPARKSAKLVAKDRDRLSKLSEYAISPFAGSINHQSKPHSFEPAAVPYASRNGPVSRLAGNVETTRKQRLQDLERIKQLKAECERFKAPNTTIDSEKSETSTTRNTPNIVIPDKFKDRMFSTAITATPRLSSENFSLEINVSARQASSAKLKAAQLLKKRPLEKINPNSTRGTKEGKRRAIDDLNDKFQMSEAKRQKTEEDEREANRRSRIERIIAATSSHKNLVDLRDMEDQSKYFDKLEKKEAMEEKMLSTYKVACKAVICQRCKYTAFSAAERCKQEQHPLKIVDAEKRFFQCKDCGNRTTSVFKLPKLSCSNCKGSRWERAAMVRDRNIVRLGDGLSIRGDEETFIGSVASTANLNLLVPEEE